MAPVKNGFIPNSFQTPNLFIDRVMPLLELSEFAVLMFAARHILGWDDVQDRCAHLSLTAFETGHRGQAGCGLSRPVIQKALETLETFGLLERVGKPSSRKGQAWKLALDEEAVQWDQMQTRRDEKQAKNQKRTRSATKASTQKRHAKNEPAVRQTYQDSSTLDVPIENGSGTSDVPISSTLDVPMTGTSDVLIETHRETQGKEKITAAPAGGEPSSSPPDETEFKPSPTPQQQMFEAICCTWGYDMASLTKTKRTEIGRVAAELVEAHAAPGKILPFKGWMDAKSKRENWGGYTVNVFPKYWPDFAAVLAAEEERQRTHKPTPIPTLDDKMEKANYIRWLHANGRADEANKVTYDDIRQLKAAGAFPLSAQLS